MGEPEASGAVPPVNGDRAGTTHLLTTDNRLRDYLAQDPTRIEPGLALFVDEDGRLGVDYETPVGRVCLLCVDARDRLVVIEIVTERNADAALARALRCRGWVRQHLAGGQDVRSVLVVERVTDSLRYLLAEVRNVELFTWEVAVTVRRAPV